jgi:transposase
MKSAYGRRATGAAFAGNLRAGGRSATTVALTIWAFSWKGYNYRGIRRYLRRRGIRAVIPTRKGQRANPRFDRCTYRRRNVIERTVGWLKECRGPATRFEKLAVNFLAMVKLAMFQRCLRLLDSPDRT